MGTGKMRVNKARADLHPRPRIWKMLLGGPWKKGSFTKKRSKLRLAVLKFWALDQGKRTSNKKKKKTGESRKKGERNEPKNQVKSACRPKGQMSKKKTGMVGPMPRNGKEGRGKFA